MITEEQSARILYGDFAPREVPRYTVAQTSRYVGVAPTTLHSWVRGRRYPKGGRFAQFQPLIEPAGDLLSFSNVIELHVLAALRRAEDVRMSRLRTAIKTAKEKCKIDRLLLSEQLRTGAGEVLLEEYGTLINLGRAGQLHLRHSLDAYLRRVEWDREGVAAQFFPGFVNIIPLPSQAKDSPRLIAIDPNVSFGQPVLASRKGIRVSSIVSRINAGETEDAVAEDYGITRQEVDAAIDFYERAA